MFTAQRLFRRDLLDRRDLGLAGDAVFVGFLNHGVENLDPFFKANGMIFGDVSGFGARAVIEQNTRTLVERGNLRP